jgi:light-regulated signal transduction histidine kinase (bacteriophytochrome)
MAEPGAPVDLTNCDREPIHLLGAVQPFGFLVALDSTQWVITRLSSNAAAWLGDGPAELVGRPIEDVFTPESIHLIRGQLQTAVFTNTVARAFSVALLADAPRFDLAVHVNDETIVIEAEPCIDEQGVNSGALVRAMIARLQQTPDLRTFYRVAAREMRGLTGFDRVMVYRFDHDGSGEVIAESARGGLESYLGLHYPASDIPRQARILYERNWLRIIPDISAKPVGVEPSLIAGRPLDLSMSVLRSVSPIHIEYLQNMGCRRLHVGVDPARWKTVGSVRLPSLWAPCRCVRKAHGGGTVRPDVLAADGEPGARQRSGLRGARAQAAQPARHRHGGGKRLASTASSPISTR